MKVARNVALAGLAYIAMVVVFEIYLGLFQPRFDENYVEEWDATIVVTTTGEDGSTQDRVVVPMTSDGHLYVSANHWPRSWYKRALANPEVRVTSGGETGEYMAVVIAPGSAEHERLLDEHPHPAWFHLMTGFPPRRFLRLEPRS